MIAMHKTWQCIHLRDGFVGPNDTSKSQRGHMVSRNGALRKLDGSHAPYEQKCFGTPSPFHLPFA